MPIANFPFEAKQWWGKSKTMQHKRPLLINILIYTFTSFL